MIDLENRVRLKSPLIVQFEITPSCNSNCGFCYNFWQYNPKKMLSRKSVIEKERIKSLLDVIIENEVLAVTFTGGEPFLAGETLFELLNTAKNAGLYTSINSNGRLINEERANRLREIGLNSILVSLHGDCAEIHDRIVGCRGAFAQGWNGIENLVNAGVNVTVNYVSTQQNIDFIVSTAQKLKDLGVKSMTFTPLLPFTGVKDHEYWAMKKEQFRKYFDSLICARELEIKVDSTLPIAPCILRDMFPQNYQQYVEVLSPRVCMAGVTFMVVSPRGFNRACIQAPQLDEYGGNVTDSFGNSWNNSHKWSESGLIPRDCSEDCHVLSSCGGGCRTSSLAINKSVSGKTMYMGNPINYEDSRVFLQRTEVKVPSVLSFRKRRDVRLREEEFGGVLANTLCQSFVFLDNKGVEAYYLMPESFRITIPNKGISSLYAAGILELSRDDAPIEVFDQEISIIHASQLFPRLARDFSNDDKVRMLRADTGERIYF